MKLIVDVKVSDLERAVRFYTKVIGLPCSVHQKEWAAITVGDAEVHLYVHGGVTEGIEFQVDDLDVEVQKLREYGVICIPGQDKIGAIAVDEQNITAFSWGRAAFFHDSEGNELALVRDL